MTSSLIKAPGDPEVHFPSSTRLRSTADFGYSCQAYLALEVAKMVFPALWVWFSRDFNPAGNVDSSNPAQIYLALSRAVQTGDVNSKIIRGYTATLLETVSKYADSSQKTALENDINQAPIDWFRPQVWLLDLASIAQHNGVNTVDELLTQCEQDAESEVGKTPGQVRQPDEYLLKNLQTDEYAIIVNG